MNTQNHNQLYRHVLFMTECSQSFKRLLTTTSIPLTKRARCLAGKLTVAGSITGGNIYF